MYYKLKHYEDLEQKGLLLELPCHINDTVYGYSMKQHRVIPFEITKMYLDYNSDKKLELFIEGESINQDSFKLPLSDFNEQMFLTKEESKVITDTSFTKKYPTYIISYKSLVESPLI